MGISMVPHIVEHILAKASKDVVFGLGIPLLIFLLKWSKSGILSQRRESFGCGFYAFDVTCPEVGLHPYFLI